MSTFLRKAARDLQGERARSASIVVALALGITGFLSVLSTYAILTRALNDGYRATNPAAATLAVDRLDEAGVRAALEVPGVGSAEGRRSVHGRVRTGPAEWRNLILFARRDLAHSGINTIALESGAWPKGPDEIALERDAMGVAKARVGDRVTVRTAAGAERVVRVVGSTHDVGKAQARMENLVYGYVAFEALASLGEGPYYDELAITLAQGSQDVARTREVAQAVAASVRAGASLPIEVPAPGEHPHAKIMGLLLLSIAAFGVFVLALSGAIVFNVLTALLAGQTRQIGVMKALGGSRWQIASIFLLEAGLLGVAAIVLAIPLGIFGGRLLSRMMSGFLNFDIASYGVPAWVLLAVFVVGVGVPVAAAVLPVWLGTRTPVRDALAPGGKVGRSFGTSIVDRALAAVGGGSQVLLLAMRNVERSRLRVALTLGTLILSGIFFMSALNLRQAMIKTVDRLLDGQRPDLSVTLTGDGPVEALERAARSTPRAVASEAWIMVSGEYGGPSALPGVPGAPPAAKVSLIGVPARSRLIRFDLASGRGFDEAGSGAVVNDALYEVLGRPALGAMVRLRVGPEEVPLAVVGVAREPFALPTAYVTREGFSGRRTPGTANVVQIALAGADPAAVDAAKTAVEAGLEREGLHVQQSNTRAERRYVLTQHMVMIYVFLIVVACILGAMGVLGLFTTVSLNVSERRREMGVLRAIGATPARVIQIVVTEGVVVGAVAWLIAVLTAGPLGGAIGNGLLTIMFKTRSDLVLTVEPKGVWVWLAVSIAGSAIASLRPAWQASRTSVREALTYE